MKEAKVQMTTGKVRMCYVVLERPRAIMEGQEPKYSIRLLIPKTDEATVGKIKSAIKAVMQKAVMEKWGGSLPDNFKNPLRDGDLEAFTSDTYSGQYFINASSRMKPLVVDADKREITHLGEVYSGCYGRAVISLYAYSTSLQSGVGCCLLGIQKLAEGERLGSFITADAFDEGEISCLD